MTSIISHFKNTLLLPIFYIGIILFFICFVSVPHSYSQESISDTTTLQDEAVRIFLDIGRTEEDHIKREIQFVNYVRDMKQAQVYVMLTQQRTGAWGMEHTLTLTGQQNFAGKNDTLVYISRQADTQEMIRSELIRVLKVGLIPYVSETPLADYIDVNYRLSAEPEKIVDKWDYWVFTQNIRGGASGEERRKNYSIDINLAADRVTPNWKMNFDLDADYNESIYKTTSDDVEETYKSVRRSNGFQAVIVKSISEHWSIGGYTSVQSSIFNNTKLSFNIAPAIEFNVFPYAQSTRREFCFLYRIGDTNIQYNEETIYGKLRENLIKESLSATYEIKERWGTLRATLEGSHYFHDHDKKRLQLNSNLSFRIIEGLSLTLNGRVSWIHDQLSLPAGEESVEDILLRLRQLATAYDYNLSVGFRYTFGSIYSNVVNPRFGSGGGGGGGGN